MLLGLAGLLGLTGLFVLTGGLGLAGRLRLTGSLRLTGGFALGLRLTSLLRLAGGLAGLVGPAGVVRLALPLLGYRSTLGIPFRRALIVALGRRGGGPAGFFLLLLCWRAVVSRSRAGRGRRGPGGARSCVPPSCAGGPHGWPRPVVPGRIARWRRHLARFLDRAVLGRVIGSDRLLAVAAILCGGAAAARAAARSARSWASCAVALPARSPDRARPAAVAVPRSPNFSRSDLRRTERSCDWPA